MAWFVDTDNKKHIIVMLNAKVKVGNSNVLKILAQATCTIPDAKDSTRAIAALCGELRNAQHAHPTKAPSYPHNPAVISCNRGLPTIAAPNQ